MLEAVLWITGFLSILFLTWFVGKYYAERSATKRVLKHHGQSGFFDAQCDDSTSNATQKQVRKQYQGRAGASKLRLAAKDGKLIDPEETPTAPSTELTKASK